ncbi:VOC family protein [Actinomadura chokoriensis]|uniref:VOC family protein n=1 Tax=Actinomadura chokoriensis TaxID=454156 RepID=UPI0031F93808
MPPRPHLDAGDGGRVRAPRGPYSHIGHAARPLAGNPPPHPSDPRPSAGRGLLPRAVGAGLGAVAVRAAGERAAGLGATRAPTPPGATFQVWHDPEGNEFCFCPLA